MATQQYEVIVPQGVGPGQPFQVNIGGQMMQIACPTNATAGMKIRVNAPAPMARAMPSAPVATATAGAQLYAGAIQGNIGQQSIIQQQQAQIAQQQRPVWFIVCATFAPRFGLARHM